MTDVPLTFNETFNITDEENDDIIWPVWSAILLTVFTLIGVVGNVFIIGAVCVSTRLRVRSNALVVNLAVADLIVSGYVIPMGIATSQAEIDKPGGVLCDMNAFISMTTCGVSTQTLMLISVERYFHVCRPQLYHRGFTVYMTGLYIALTWLYTMAWTCQGWTGWTIYIDGGSAHVCITSGEYSISYTLCLAIFGMLIPMAVISICYYNIFSTVSLSEKNISTHQKSLRSTSDNLSYDRKNTNRKSDDMIESSDENKDAKPSLNNNHLKSHKYGENNNLSAGDPKSSAPIQSSTYSKLQRTSKLHQRQNRERQLLLTLFTIVVLFVICWFPICLVLIVSLVTDVPRGIYIFAIWLAMCNSTFNSFVYGVLNKNFRNGYKRFFHAVFCCICSNLGYKHLNLFRCCVCFGGDESSASGGDQPSEGARTYFSQISSKNKSNSKTHQSNKKNISSTLHEPHSSSLSHIEFQMSENITTSGSGVNASKKTLTNGEENQGLAI